MSKASEWVKLQLIDVQAGDIKASVTHYWDRSTDRVVPMPRMMLERSDKNSKAPFYISLTPEEALQLGRWIMDIFGEASA